MPMMPQGMPMMPQGMPMMPQAMCQTMPKAMPMMPQGMPMTCQSNAIDAPRHAIDVPRPTVRMPNKGYLLKTSTKCKTRLSGAMPKAMPLMPQGTPKQGGMPLMGNGLKRCYSWANQCQ